MKLAPYVYKDEESYGILKKQTIISLPKVAAILHATLPITIDEFTALGQIEQVTVESLMAIADENMVEEASFQLSQVQLLAPIKFPPKILCLGWNYIDHAAETKITLRGACSFHEARTAIIGPGEKIVKRSKTFSATQSSTMFRLGIFSLRTSSGHRQRF
jgi:2-keto-4-pentenoate hydratase/2-oxohepta-3-ene-1,7-dioic acid hydratase in catechol pathway